MPTSPRMTQKIGPFWLRRGLAAVVVRSDRTGALAVTVCMGFILGKKKSPESAGDIQLLVLVCRAVEVPERAEHAAHHSAIIHCENHLRNLRAA